MSTVKEPTLIKVRVSDELYERAEQIAKKTDTTTERVIERLLLAVGVIVDSTKPLVLDDVSRQHLEKLLARNFTLPEELVFAIQRMVTLDVGGVHVPLTPYLLDRLQTRAIGMTFDKFLQMTVKRLLEEYAGIR